MPGFQKAAACISLLLLLAATFHGSCHAQQVTLKMPPKPEQRRPVPPSQFGGTSLKRYMLSANGFNVEVNAAGNAPFFTFYADGKEGSKQRLWMEKIWQTTNISRPAPDASSGRPPLKKINLNGMYNWALSSTSTFNSTLASSTTETVFTLRGTPIMPGDASNPKPNLLFTNHFVSSTNGTELKFDVEISNYADAWWDPAATGLVLAYRMETLNEMDGARDTPLQGMKKLQDVKRPVRPMPGRNSSLQQQQQQQPQPQQQNPPPKADAIDLGNGYGFESATVAADGAQMPINATVNVGVDDSKPHILVAYGRFSQTLRHDPVMYTADTSSAADPSATAAAPTYDSSGNLLPPGTVILTTTTPPPPPSSTPKSSSSSALQANMGLAVMLAAATLAMLAASSTPAMPR